MNVAKRIWVQHCINVTLSIIGVLGSLYIIGWVDHENRVAIGFTYFSLSVILLVITTINYNVVMNKINRNKD